MTTSIRVIAKTRNKQQQNTHYYGTYKGETNHRYTNGKEYYIKHNLSDINTMLVETNQGTYSRFTVDRVALLFERI